MSKKVETKESEIAAMKAGGEGYIRMATYRTQLEQLTNTRDQLQRSIGEKSQMQKLFYQERRAGEVKEQEISRLKKLFEEHQRHSVGDQSAEREHALKLQEKDFQVTDLKTKIVNLRLASEQREERLQERNNDLNEQVVYARNDAIALGNEMWELECKADGAKRLQQDNAKLENQVSQLSTEHKHLVQLVRDLQAQKRCS
jgi:hypothetical protein